MVRVALVGCGIISQSHVRGYAAHRERARITVCCDIDQARANARADQVAELMGARPHVTTSYEAVLDDPDVESVELCTPSHLHADAVVAAAGAGKHIHCQKPLATSLADSDRMIAAASDAGVTLFYGEYYRTWASARLANEMISEGSLGEIACMRSTYAFGQSGEYAKTAWRYDPRIAGGGQLLDGGIHNLDLLRSVGGPIDTVSAFARRVRPELGGEDTTTLIFRFQNGVLGTQTSTHAAATLYRGPVLVVFGTEATLEIAGPPGVLTLYRKDRHGEAEVTPAPEPDLFASMVGHYLDVLGGAPSLCTAESGREMLQIVLACYRSAETGCAERVADIAP